MKSLSFYIFFLLLLLKFNCSAQILPGAKQIALSHSSVALSHDAFSHFTNPAGLAQLNWREVAVFYSPSPFGMNELANAYAVYLEPLSFGALSLGFMHYGFDLYKQNKISVAYAGRFYDRLLLGFNFTYNNVSIKKYGNANSFNLLIGAIAVVKDDFRFGFSYDNLTRSSYQKTENQIPSILSFGICYEPMDNILVNLSYLKELDFDPSFNFGIDYCFTQYLNLRFGFMTEPSSFSAGFGLNYSLFELDYATFNHPDLGFTHQFGININFGNEGNRIDKINRFLGFE